MNRREFLRRALSLAPAAIIVPPAVKYFLPPLGGWRGWQRYSGYYGYSVDFVSRSEPRMTATEVIQRMKDAMARIPPEVNPPLLVLNEAWLDLVTHGNSALKIEPGRVHLVPARMLPR